MTSAGKYLLLDRVGVGGMAEVFRAKSLGIEGFEKIVAIKRIRPQLAADETFVQMFVDEAKIAGQLRHENIVRIHELGKLQGTHFIAMEYVFGKDLLQILGTLKRADQVMAPAMAAWIGAKVLAGLHYAHTKRGDDGHPLGLIHRDISPQNVLVSYDGVVKLIDFGIAKAASRAVQTMAGIIKGKVGYMSPEQIMGAPLDHRSDVFAASTCLHEMLTCRRLFRAPSDAQVIDRVRNARADPPSRFNPRVPQELDDIVMKGLAKDADDRWSTAGEMHEALMRYITGTQPPFGSPQLRLVMRSMFSDEVSEQYKHLEALSQVAQEGVSVVKEGVSMAKDGSSITLAPEHQTDAEQFVGADTVLSMSPVDMMLGELSAVVTVDEIVAVGSPGGLDEDDEVSAPFLLVSKPPPEPTGPPEAFMPGSTQAIPLVVRSGEFDLDDPLVDTSEEFKRPFLGGEGVAGAYVPPLLPEGASIPEMAVPATDAMWTPPQPPPDTAQAPRSTYVPPPAQAPAGIPWGLLALTALIAIVLGAGGVLAVLFATGVLQVP